MKSFLLSQVYNFLLLIFLLVDIGKWLVENLTSLLRGKSSKTKRDWAWGQKFGLPIGRAFPDAGQNVVLHCASMGEVVAANKLILGLLNLSANINVIVTTNTLTGKEQVKRQFSAQFNQRIFHHYLPIDLPFLSSSLLKKCRAKMLMVLEVELWPNLIKSASNKQLPILIANARLTNKTAKGYRKFSSLTSPMLQRLTTVFTRNDKDYENYLSMGVDKSKLVEAGNIKFDLKLPDAELANKWQQKLQLKSRLVLVAGSTHEGEEQLMLQAYKQLKQQHENLLLLIAPRHPHRFELVSNLVKNQQLNVIELANQEQVDSETDIVIINKMGVLSEVYSIADVVFVGGSVVNKGGHNPIEASVFSKPVIMGSHIQNNPEIINTIADNSGLYIAQSEFEVMAKLSEWFNNTELRQQVGANGLQCIAENQGAVETILAHIRAELSL